MLCEWLLVNHELTQTPTKTSPLYVGFLGRSLAIMRSNTEKNMTDKNETLDQMRMRFRKERETEFKRNKPEPKIPELQYHILKKFPSLKSLIIQS